MLWPQDHAPLFAAVFWEIGVVLTCFPVATHSYEASASTHKALIKYTVIIVLADAEDRLSAALR